jgi:putative OPT family oligopeptide transporter
MLSNKKRLPTEAQKSLSELTVRSIVLAIILTILLATSNAYLALKLGILTSASIPAAIISMGILRLFKNATILENNAVQTAASAGEAVAGGIVYTIPALIIIQYWHYFDYATNVFIAAIGGILGVLFSIPLRRVLVNEPALTFPEGQAIAEVLKSSSKQVTIYDIVLGGIVGAGLELLQTGLKIVASSWHFWFVIKRTIFGFGIGFSATMIGAGYLIGHYMAISIFLGAVLAWLIVTPIVSCLYPDVLAHYPLEKAALLLWDNQIRYVGIGAMLFAGIWTFLQLTRPLMQSILQSRQLPKYKYYKKPSTDCDIPLSFVITGILIMAIVLIIFFQLILPLQTLGFNHHYHVMLILGAVFYILVVGFLFSVITSYLSGMVGVSASPGSSIVIAGMLFAAWLLLMLINQVLPFPLDSNQLKAAEAITIIIGAVVTGIAAIANDNTQDLKVGQLVGATPWKQQLMLLLGVVISALVIPLVMQLLFEVYGIAGIMPHEGMDASLSLPAPTAALMAAITEAVFHHTVPWTMMLAGMMIILALVILIKCLSGQNYLKKLSILGVAIGMYLPIASSIALFLGGMLALFMQKQVEKKKLMHPDTVYRLQVGTLIACGLVAGAALIDVLLAIPFSIYHTPEALSIVGLGWYPYSIFLGMISIFMVARLIRQRIYC